jgi:dTDP-4-amino-4,6-dideoxygalactose transaminase
MEELSRLKDDYEIFLISDSSHAHEAEWDGKRIGTFFDINFASFGMGKLISGGELGIATTDNSLLRDRMILFGHTNRTPKDLITESYITINNAVGVKLRPHLFALLLALADYKENIEQRRKIVSAVTQFKQNISDQTDKIKFVDSYEKTRRVYWKPLIIFENEVNIEELIETLLKKNIGAEKHNYRVPLDKNTIFTEFYKIRSESTFPITSSFASRSIIQIASKDFLDEKKTKTLTDTILKYVDNRNW